MWGEQNPLSWTCPPSWVLRRAGVSHSQGFSPTTWLSSLQPIWVFSPGQDLATQLQRRQWQGWEQSLSAPSMAPPAEVFTEQGGPVVGASTQSLAFITPLPLPTLAKRLGRSWAELG